MSENKDMFNDLIKDKLENFEVPYNEAHWADMNDKLDANPPQSGGGGQTSGGMITKYAVVSGIAAAVVAGYFMFSSEENVTPDVIQENAVVEVNETPAPSKAEKNINISEPEKQASESVSNETEPTQNDDQAVIAAELPEEKEDRYAEYQEEQLKNEGKAFVDQVMNDQKKEMKNEPVLDNSALRTEIVINDEIKCAGRKVQFQVSRQIEGASYYWNFGDKGLTSRKANPMHEFKRAGEFNVTLLVSAGEKNDYKVEKTIRIEASPEVNIEFGEDAITLNDPYADFHAYSNEDCKFQWKFNESNVKKGQDASFLIQDKGVYPVEVTATSQDGCSRTANETYFADKGVKMIVEDAFTPNGDGLNDDFLPKELQTANVEFVMIIRDKSGQQIYETRDAYAPWNGKMNNQGNLMPKGSYFWVVKFNDDRGRAHTQEGRVIIQ